MDAESFKQSFLPCHSKLYQVAFRLLRNSDDAQDMVQETYIKLWDKREELGDVKNAESFSVTVLKNICFDYLRNSKNFMDDKGIENLTSNEIESVEKNLEIADEFNYIKKLIKLLPPQQQKIIYLRDINEYSLKEIEQITGLNPINVRTLLSRARKKIREYFATSTEYGRR